MRERERDVFVFNVVCGRECLCVCVCVCVFFCFCCFFVLCFVLFLPDVSIKRFGLFIEVALTEELVGGGGGGRF